MHALRLQIVLFLFIVFPLVSLAQLQGQPFIDSLLKELPKMPDDTNKVIALGDISFNYRIIDSEKGISYGEQCLELAKKINYPRGIAKAYNSLGTCYKANSNYPMALKNYHLALSTFESQGMKNECATVLMNIGTVYRPLKNYRKAILYYDKALAIAKRIRNRKMQAQLLGNKGVIYFETGQYTKQQEVNKQALVIFREIGDEDNEAWILSNQGDSYAKTGDYQKGIDFHRKAIEIYDRLNNQSYKSTSLLSIGIIYYEQALRIKNNPAEARKLLNLSIETLQESKRLLIELNDIDYLKDVYEALSNTQETAGDYASALKSFKLYTALKDSVFFR